MDGYIDVLVSGLNTVGRGFCDYAAAMFLQVGMLVAVLLMLDLLLRRRIRATVRYWIWMLVFLKLLLPPGLSLPTGIGYWCGGHFSMLPAGGNDRFVERGTIAELVASDAGRPTTRAAQPQPSDERAAVSPEDVVARGGKMAEAGESLPVAQEHFTWQAVVFLLWGGGVLTLVGWVVRRLLFVKRLIAESTSANEDVREVLGRCRRRIGIRRQIELRLSPGALGPAVCGLVRPIILMPKALLERLPPEQLEPVLIHELAHIERADLWVNCLQTALQIIYFYNPLVWLANAIVRRVREQAVDEMTLVALGAEAGSYGRTLIDIAEMTFLRPTPALASWAWPSRGSHWKEGSNT